jgi:hypothetical protein
MPWLKCIICEKEVFHEYRGPLRSPCCSDQCRKVYAFLERIKLSSIDDLGIVPKFESIGQNKKSYSY